MKLQNIIQKEPKDITREEWQALIDSGICNGFGPTQSKVVAFILNRIAKKLSRASADWHDVAYEIGGKEEDRVRADTGFLRYMLIDILRISGVRKYYYRFLSYVYYFAVRTLGKKFFNYHTRKF